MCFYLLKCEKFHFSVFFLIKYPSIGKTQDPAVCRWLFCCKLVIKLLWCNVLYHAIIPSLIEMCRMILLYYILPVKLSICLILFLCYTSRRAFASQIYVYNLLCRVLRLRRSLATSTLYAAVRIPAERFCAIGTKFPIAQKTTARRTGQSSNRE